MIWNVVGFLIPLLVGLIAIPLLIHDLGKEKFGLLALVWMVVGYFSLFDFGLGRALTKLVAEKIGQNDIKDLSVLIWTSLPLVISLGLMGALLVFFSSQPLVEHILKVSPSLQKEAIASFEVLSLGLPAIVLTSALVGLLEARQKFPLIVSIRIPLGIFIFLGPLLVAQFTLNLVWITVTLLAARVLAALSYFFAVAFNYPELKNPYWPSRKYLSSLFHFGGWVSISNIIGPMMVYFDRFLIAAVLGLTAVTYYVAPYEVIFRIEFLPNAIMNVMFPAFAMALAVDSGYMQKQYRKIVDLLYLLILPITAFFFFLAPELLTFWLGPKFATVSLHVVQWMAMGMFVNVLARPAFSVLQAAGRPDLVAKAHMFELFPYVFLVWFLTTRFGISGTAAAWFIRAMVDALILNLLARHAVPGLQTTIKVILIRLLLVSLLFYSVFGLHLLLGRIILLCVFVIYAAIRFRSIFRDILFQIFHSRKIESTQL